MEETKKENGILGFFKEAGQTIVQGVQKIMAPRAHTVFKTAAAGALLYKTTSYMATDIPQVDFAYKALAILMGTAATYILHAKTEKDDKVKKEIYDGSHKKQIQMKQYLQDGLFAILPAAPLVAEQLGATPDMVQGIATSAAGLLTGYTLIRTFMHQGITSNSGAEIREARFAARHQDKTLQRGTRAFKPR